MYIYLCMHAHKSSLHAYAVNLPIAQPVPATIVNDLSSEYTLQWLVRYLHCADSVRLCRLERVQRDYPRRGSLTHSLPIYMLSVIKKFFIPFIQN